MSFIGRWRTGSKAMRHSQRGFVIFVGMFWCMVAALFGLVSYLIPSSRGTGFMTRILAGVGGAIGSFCSAVAIGMVISGGERGVSATELQAWAFIIFSFAGGGLGCWAGARVAILSRIHR